MTCIQSLLKPTFEVQCPDPAFALTRGSDLAAGYDLRLMSNNDDLSPTAVHPGMVVKFKTGIKVNMANPHIAMLILPRSGLGTRGIHIANQTGLIDADYQGDVIVALRNVSNEMFYVNHGERIAQALFVPVIHPTFQLVEAFSNTTERGEGGFNSTGTK